MSAWDDDEEYVASSSKQAPPGWDEDEPDTSQQAPSLDWAAEDETTYVPPEVEEELPHDEETGVEEYDDDIVDIEDAREAELLDRDTRIRNEAFILSSEPFVEKPYDQICNLDLTPLLRNNYPNPKLMESISDCFSDIVEVDEDGDFFAQPLKGKICEPIKGAPGQTRFVIEINGVPFVLRREDYSDWNDDICHQYLSMALMRKLYRKVPMFIYPFAIFRASYDLQYSGDKTKDFNYMLMQYISFNRQDTHSGVNKNSNDPARRQLSFHNAVAPPYQGSGNIVKPILDPLHAWYLIKMMIKFLEYAGTYYLFSHGDAHYHNWLIRDLGEVKMIAIPYVDDEKRTHKFHTRHLPVLGDFSRSSFIYADKRYGTKSSYYAVPPPVDKTIYHDMAQLMFGFVKDMDAIRFKNARRGYYLNHYFNEAIRYFYRKDPVEYADFRDIDIVKGSDNRGTSFAEMARLFSGKSEVIQYIFDNIDRDFTSPVKDFGEPLRASTEPVKTLNKNCPPLRKYPANYNLPIKSDANFQDGRRRSEIINHLREDDFDSPRETLDYLIDYMDLSVKLDQYDSKEGLVISRVTKFLESKGLTADRYSDGQREIYNNFMKLKTKKDEEQRSRRRETSTAQISLAGPVEYITIPQRSESPRGRYSRESSPRGGYSRGGYSRGGYSRGGYSGGSPFGSRHSSGRSSAPDEEGFSSVFSRRR